MRVLIGGVGYRWAGDQSFGLAVSDALSGETWPENVTVADLGYGAVYVTLDIADSRPPLDRLILIGAISRKGRLPGKLYEKKWKPQMVEDDDAVQGRIREAGGGVIDLDHLLVIAQRFGVLPRDVICLELEPSSHQNGAELSESAAQQVPAACSLARNFALAS